MAFRTPSVALQTLAVAFRTPSAALRSFQQAFPKHCINHPFAERHRGRSLQIRGDHMSPSEIRSEILDILSDIAPDEDLSMLADDKPFR